MRPERHAEGADLLAHAHRVSFEAASVEDERGRSQFEDGAQGRNRTTDTVIFSHVLYQLSYLGSRDGQGARSSERLP